MPIPYRQHLKLTGGTDSSNIENEIQFINLVSTGNTVDFGDTNIASTSMGGHSNGHGGLG